MIDIEVGVAVPFPITRDFDPSSNKIEEEFCSTR